MHAAAALHAVGSQLATAMCRPMLSQLFENNTQLLFILHCLPALLSIVALLLVTYNNVQIHIYRAHSSTAINAGVTYMASYVLHKIGTCILSFVP
jgi:hypothetical protein